MACTKSLSMSEASSGESPLHDAAYVPAPIDKIFGTSGPYVIRFNATTGVREAIVRLSSPMYGDCRICYHSGSGMLFAAGHNQVNQKNFALTQQARDIWQVNPSTLAVTPLNVGTWVTQFDFNVGDVFGPQWIKPLGNYIYFQAEARDTGFRWARVNATNFADHNMGSTGAIQPMNTEQFEVAGGFVYHIEPRFGVITEDTVAGAFNNSMNVSPNPIVAIQQAPLDALLYFVCGNSDFIRIDSFGAALTTTFGLGAGRNPVRLKFLSDNKCYMPSMATNEIILFDTIAESVSYKTGFDNPVDVVDTGAKKWAVQNAPVGLKEIT